MPIPRESPYVWATWLPKLLTGDNSCEWAVWLKAHYQDWARMPSDFNQADWLLKHTALLNEQKAKWEERGYDVHVEGQNAFRLRGKAATLAGRPDLIVDRFDDALIIDVKTGREQAWHVAQVMIYMYALPKTLPQYRNVRLAGEIAYPTPHGRSSRSRPARRVRAEPRIADTAAGVRHAAPKDAERPRVPVLRHQRCGLPGACGPGNGDT